MIFDILPEPVVQLSVRVTALLAATAIADRLLRDRASAAVRHLLWTSTMIAALLLPIFAFSLPKLVVPVATRRISMPAAPADSVTVESAPRVAKRFVEQDGGISSLGRVDSRTMSTSSLTTLLGLMYAAGVLLILARLVGDQVAVRRLLRGSVALESAEWSSSSVPVRMVSNDTPPLTVGISRPTIVVPRSAGSWSDDRRRAVLLHECAHVERLDCATQIVAAIACAVYWPHPLIWLGAARMRLERELACDDAVLNRGMVATDYAAHLLEIARGLSASRTPVVAVSMAAQTQLERRLRAVIQAHRPRESVRRKAVLAATASTFAAVLPLSSVMATTRVEFIPAPSLSNAAGHAVVEPTLPIVARPTPSAVVQPTHPANVQPTLRGRFNVWLNAERSHGADTVVHLTLFIPGAAGIIGADYPISRFDGLTAGQLRTAAADLRFRLVAKAGTVAFSGMMQGADGNGAFEFSADSTYNADLRRRGVRISEGEQIALALSGRPASEVASRSALLEPAPGLADRAEPPRPQPQPSAEEHPSPLNGKWRATPGRGNSIRLDIEWSDVNQWNRLIEPGALTAIPGGFKYRTDAGEITFWGDLNDRRGSGTMLFAPNRAFADTLVQLGIGDATHVSTHDLKNLAFYGMNAAAIREFMALGVGPLTKGDILGLAIFGVTPEFARFVRDAGERDLSPENLVSLKRTGRSR